MFKLELKYQAQIEYKPFELLLNILASLLNI